MPLSTFILSELYSGSITYGRELQRRFEAAGILSWGRVAHSSVYRALAVLERKGLVARYRSPPRSDPLLNGRRSLRDLQNEPVQDSRRLRSNLQSDPLLNGCRSLRDLQNEPHLAGGQPAKCGSLRNRKFYAITKAGRRAFEACLSGELAEPCTYRNPLNIAVHCLMALPSRQAVAFLGERRARLSSLEAEASRIAASARRGGKGSDYERLAAERILMKTRAELFFAGSLADYLRGG
jgi:DNA-binding PadR family transcriptional regulator